jgi:hypothetical protein
VGAAIYGEKWGENKGVIGHPSTRAKYDPYLGLTVTVLAELKSTINDEDDDIKKQYSLCERDFARIIGIFSTL